MPECSINYSYKRPNINYAAMMLTLADKNKLDDLVLESNESWRLCNNDIYASIGMHITDRP